MTVAPRESGAVATDDDGMTGLEDFDVSTDAVMPRLKIIGKEAQFEDSLSGERFDSITAVLLGMVKQRILWAPEVDDGDGPLCRSLDFKTGLPYLKEFPWKESGFKAPAADAEDVELPCNSCALKEWGTNPKGSTPWCSEQHTFPLLLLSGPDDTEGMPALLTLQRSGIKPSKAYVSSFVRSKSPLYTAVTTIGLQAQKRGTVDYAVPILRKGNATDAEMWPVYAQHYRQIRNYLQTPRTEEAPTDEGSSTPTAATTTAGSKPSYADDDEPPF